MDILLAELLSDVSVGPGHRSGQSPKRGVHQFNRVTSCEWLLKKPSNFKENIIWNDQKWFQKPQSNKISVRCRVTKSSFQLLLGLKPVEYFTPRETPRGATDLRLFHKGWKAKTMEPTPALWIIYIRRYRMPSEEWTDDGVTLQPGGSLSIYGKVTKIPLQRHYRKWFHLLTLRWWRPRSCTKEHVFRSLQYLNEVHTRKDTIYYRNRKKWGPTLPRYMHYQKWEPVQIQSFPETSQQRRLRTYIFNSGHSEKVKSGIVKVSFCMLFVCVTTNFGKAYILVYEAQIP